MRGWGPFRTSPTTRTATFVFHRKPAPTSFPSLDVWALPALFIVSILFGTLLQSLTN
eukprot:m.89915 g.89915  ORF g.89915 m.89915 type:complete len:57 (-) comp20105_c0_seq1:148-318(-)